MLVSVSGSIDLSPRRCRRTFHRCLVTRCWRSAANLIAVPGDPDRPGESKDRDRRGSLEVNPAAPLPIIVCRPLWLGYGSVQPHLGTCRRYNFRTVAKYAYSPCTASVVTVGAVAVARGGARTARRSLRAALSVAHHTAQSGLISRVNGVSTAQKQIPLVDC